MGAWGGPVEAPTPRSDFEGRPGYAEVGGAQRLLYEFLNPALKQLPARHRKFRANRSLRDVEPNVNLWLRTLDNLEVPEEAE
jgi:hypothetical protein